MILVRKVRHLDRIQQIEFAFIQKMIKIMVLGAQLVPRRALRQAELGQVRVHAQEALHEVVGLLLALLLQVRSRPFTVQR